MKESRDSLTVGGFLLSLFCNNISVEICISKLQYVFISCISCIFHSFVLRFVAKETTRTKQFLIYCESLRKKFSLELLAPQSHKVSEEKQRKKGNTFLFWHIIFYLCRKAIFVTAHMASIMMSCHVRTKFAFEGKQAGMLGSIGSCLAGCKKTTKQQKTKKNEVKTILSEQKFVGTHNGLKHSEMPKSKIKKKKLSERKKIFFSENESYLILHELPRNHISMGRGGGPAMDRQLDRQTHIAA